MNAPDERLAEFFLLIANSSRVNSLALPNIVPVNYRTSSSLPSEQLLTYKSNN